MNHALLGRFPSLDRRRIRNASSRSGGRSASLTLVLGIILYSVPTQPVGPAPWILSVVGAVIFGAGLVGIGYGVWSLAQEAREQGP